MSRLIIVMMVLGATICSCAQTRFIKKSNAFISIGYPGKKPVDLQGNEIYKAPDTVIQVYAEVSKDQIKWKHAWKGSRHYSITSSVLSEKKEEIGTNKKTGQPVVLFASPNNHFELLELVPSDESLIYTGKLLPGEIVLEGELNGKTFRHKISKITPIEKLPKG